MLYILQVLKDKIWLKMSDEMMMIGAYLTFKMCIIACNLKNTTKLRI